MPSPLNRLAEIQEEIADLKREAHALFDALALNFGNEVSASAPSKTEIPPSPKARKRKPSPSAGKPRPASPSGPLSPAVIAVLQETGCAPMKGGALFESLLAKGYVFVAADQKIAKRNFIARLYMLPGVQAVGGGMFSLTAA